MEEEKKMEFRIRRIMNSVMRKMGEVIRMMMGEEEEVGGGGRRWSLGRGGRTV